MSTRNIVPRADGEGGIGTSAKNWNEVRTKNLYIDNAKADVYTLAQMIQTDPVFYSRTNLFEPNRAQFTMPEVTNINIGGYGYSLPSYTYYLADATVWDDPQYVTAGNRAGKDFYIYLCQPNPATISTRPVLILSANSTVPTGYTAVNSRKIGGFHCLCVSVGTISGHALSDYVAGDIIPLSVWDMKHRPISAPEGMVYVDGIGKWVDIYLSSWDGSSLVSAYGATIADGASSPNWHGEKFAEYLGLVGKSLLWRDEFIVVAKGSNETTNIKNSADPGTTGGHIDTNNRRMISNYGLEDCCGALWQWARDVTEFYPGASWNPTTNQFLAGYYWQTSSVYHSGTDPQSYGSCGGLLRRLLLGGDWDDGSYCGSRCAYCQDCSARGGLANFAARGASEPRIS